MHINIEFKARCNDIEKVKEILQRKGANYKGKDYQTDVYFNVPNGRLKLRKGNIENKLIGYKRVNSTGTKQSKVYLFITERETNLEEVLKATLGIKIIVKKQRDIYFLNNVKFHIDEVDELGSFIEVEAIDSEGKIGKEKLQQQCDYYKNLFKIREEDMVSHSYSDLLLHKK